MKKIILLSLLVFGFATFSANAQDNSVEDLSKKLLLAKEYSEIYPMDVEINDAIDSLVLNVPKSERVLFKTILQRYIKVPRLVSVSEMALAETFTEAELKAMIAFYGTPEGRSIREKMPVYRETIDPILEQMVAESVRAYESQQSR